MELPTIRTGGNIRDDIEALIRYLKSEMITSVIGGKFKGSPVGKALIIDRVNNVESPQGKLPFEISATGTSIKAESGIFCEETIDAIIETLPADGTWYLQGLLVIDSGTGEIVSRYVEWSQTEGTNSATDFYTTIGAINVVDGVPDPTSIGQMQYGTIVGIVHGAYGNVWSVTFF